MPEPAIDAMAGEFFSHRTAKDLWREETNLSKENAKSNYTSSLHAGICIAKYIYEAMKNI